MDLATGNSFSAGYLGQPAALFCGDLTADECPMSPNAHHASNPANLNSTEVTRPSLFSICSGILSMDRREASEFNKFFFAPFV
jgi:hypothetical protein